MTWHTILGEKLDKQIDLEKSIKAGILPATPRDLIGLHGRKFL